MDDNINPGRVLRELAGIGFADILDYVAVTPEGELALRPTEEIPPQARAAVVGIKQGPRGIEIKLADKLSALEKLGRHMGLFDRREPGGIEDVEDLRREIFGDEYGE